MSAQLVLPALPVADPEWVEEVERAARRERQQQRRLEVRDAVRRVVARADDGYGVSTGDIVRAFAFEGSDYLMGYPDEAPEAWHEVACRLMDAAKHGLIRHGGREVIFDRGQPRSYRVYWTVDL